MPSTTPTEEVDATLKKSAVQYRCWEEYLEEQKKRLAYLQTLEKQFLATRDIALLKEFKDKKDPPKVELAEKVKKPCVIWEDDNWLEEAPTRGALLARVMVLNMREEEAKLLNPDVKIRHIKGKNDGHLYLVYEGIDKHEYVAFCHLRDAERKAEQEIKQLADSCVSPNYTTRIAQEKLASSQSPQTPSH